MGLVFAVVLLIIGGGLIYIGATGSQKKAWQLITHPRFP